MKVHSFTRHARVIVASAIAITAVVMVAGCSSNTQSPRHDNSADVMFNQMMIPHHQQAVEMAAMVDSRTQNADVRRLAASIAAAQQPQIDQMTARLRSWGAPTSAAMSMEMAGGMTRHSMSALSAASATAFDTLWLHGMIAHHQGAVEMAATELANGIDPDSRRLATEITTAQNEEIAHMRMLGTAGGR